MPRTRQATSGILGLICLAISVMIVIVMCGCAKYETITASEITDRELWLTAKTYQRCRQIGVFNVKVEFTNWRFTGWFGTAAMWSYGKENRIAVWRPIMTDPLYTNELLDRYVQHECCHCKLNHQSYDDMTTPEKEALEEEAAQCERENWPS